MRKATVTEGKLLPTFPFPAEARLFGLPPDQGRWLFIPLGLMVLLCLVRFIPGAFLAAPLRQNSKVVRVRFYCHFWFWESPLPW
ncbi:MAG: hypothetical protein AAFX95_17545 [Cyanobacteria bacterium J06639_16]